MKSSTMRWMIAAAALAVVAGTASAQTYKAEIPVSFRAGDKAMLPGSYEVKVESGNTGIPQVFVRNLDDYKQVLLVARPGNDAPKAWRDAGKPVFAFECAEGRCVLRNMWTAKDVATYTFPGSITPHGDNKVALLLVPLNRAE